MGRKENSDHSEALPYSTINSRITAGGRLGPVSKSIPPESIPRGPQSEYAPSESTYLYDDVEERVSPAKSQKMNVCILFTVLAVVAASGVAVGGYFGCE